mgnify:CR=1 FL=1
MGWEKEISHGQFTGKILHFHHSKFSNKYINFASSVAIIPKKEWSVGLTHEQKVSSQPLASSQTTRSEDVGRRSPEREEKLWIVPGEEEHGQQDTMALRLLLLEQSDRPESRSFEKRK